MPKQVIVMDPDLSTQLRLQQLMIPFSITPSCFSSGHHLLQTGKIHNVIGIFMELELPDIDGLSLLNELHKIYDCPIIILSSGTNVKMAVSALKQNIFDFINKPGRDSIISDRISELLHTAQQHQTTITVTNTTH